MKECSKCHEILDLDQFYKNAKYKDGHRSECKSCMSIAGKERYKKINTERQWDPEATKICSSCQRILQISDFRKNKNALDGYRNKCKQCMSSLPTIGADEKVPPIEELPAYESPGIPDGEEIRMPLEYNEPEPLPLEELPAELEAEEAEIMVIPKKNIRVSVKVDGEGIEELLRSDNLGLYVDVQISLTRPL